MLHVVGRGACQHGRAKKKSQGLLSLQVMQELCLMQYELPYPAWWLESERKRNIDGASLVI